MKLFTNKRECKDRYHTKLSFTLFPGIRHLLCLNKRCPLKKAELLVRDLSVSGRPCWGHPDNTSHSTVIIFFFTSLSKRLHGISKMFSIQDVAQYHKQKLKDPFLIQL